MRYLIDRPDRVLALALEHLRICAVALLIAIAIGVPLGILLTRVRWLEAPIVGAVGVLYTIPSLALFAVLIPFTGLGAAPAIVALVLYSLLAIVRNTIAGIDSVDPLTLDAARGMGMTARQRLLLVQLPLGLPIILGGVRVAAVTAISITTIGAAIGAGGLGLLIFEGIRTLNGDRIIAGTLAIAALAIAVDRGLAWWGERLRRDAAGAGERG